MPARYVFPKNDWTQYITSVAMIVNNNWIKFFLNVFPISDRIFRLQMKDTNTRKLNSIKTYPPTNDNEDDKIDLLICCCIRSNIYIAYKG